MKTWAVMLLMMLGSGRMVPAQDLAGGVEPKIAANLAVDSLSAASAGASPINTGATAVLAAGDLGNAALWSRGESLNASAVPAEGVGGFATSAAQRTVDMAETDMLRWQVAIGPSFVRFRSSVFNASMAGTITSVAWAKNEWLSAEGQVVTGFAPVIYKNEHVKYVSYAAGVKVGSQKQRWEPFAHALIGGAHEQPQTPGFGRNAFMIEAGGGADYRLWPRMSVRAEADYVHAMFFRSSQNNFQFSLAAVFHF